MSKEQEYLKAFVTRNSNWDAATINIVGEAIIDGLKKAGVIHQDFIPTLAITTAVIAMACNNGDAISNLSHLGGNVVDSIMVLMADDLTDNVLTEKHTV